jgi:hypothetical protein
MIVKRGLLIRYLVPRLQDVLFGSLLAVVILFGPRLFNEDGDLGRHITVGRFILDNRMIPLTDVFSHTMSGAALVPHEWLAQVLFALADRMMGLDGDVLLTAFVIAASFLLAYQEAMRRGVFRLVGLLSILWAAAASSLHWLARPHVFTLLLIALWTSQLENVSERGSRNLWAFPLLMWLWANTHGAFIAGFVILGIYCLEWVWEYRQGRASRQAGQQLGLIAVTSALATLLNPAGGKLWGTSLGYIGNNYLVSRTVEYMSPDFHHPVTWPFLAMATLGLFALAWGKQLRLREGMLLGTWAAMGLYSARNIPLFAIVCAPIFAELIQTQAGKMRWMEGLEGGLGQIESQLSGSLWPTLAILSAGLLLSQNIPLDLSRRGNEFDPRAFPVAAADWLQAHPQQGNGFNWFTWGGYLLYRSWPGQTVFIDGQTDFYGEALTREYETVITTGPGWKDILQKYQVTWMILPSGTRLVEDLKAENWRSLYEDSTTAVLKKP